MHAHDARVQRLAVWGGLLWGVLFFLAFWMIAQFPPISPMWNGEQILASVQENYFLAKAGIPLGILAAGLGIPFNALIAGYIAKIEKQTDSMPILAIASFGGGVLNVMAFLLIFYGWAGMFYRESPDLGAVLLVSDIIWLIIVMAFSPPALQMVCIALAGFRDQSATPVFPRWYSFLMLWIAFGTCTGCIAIYFFDGPFSWWGIIGFWIPATAYCVWLLSLCYMFLKHIRHLERP